VLLGRGRVRLAGPVAELVGAHRAPLEEIVLRHLRGEEEAA
jgi:hypothetical protein